MIPTITYCEECGREFSNALTVEQKDMIQEKINVVIDAVTPPEIPDAITREQYHENVQKLKRHLQSAVARSLFNM